MKTVVGRAYTTGPKPDLQPRFPLEELRATWWLEKKPTAIVYDRDKKMLGVLLVKPPPWLDSPGDTYRLPVHERLPITVEPGELASSLDIRHVDLEVGPVWALHDERRLSFTLRSGDVDSLSLDVFWPLEKAFFPRLDVLATMDRNYRRRDQRALWSLLLECDRELRLRAAPPN